MKVVFASRSLYIGIAIGPLVKSQMLKSLNSVCKICCVILKLFVVRTGQKNSLFFSLHGR